MPSPCTKVTRPARALTPANRLSVDYEAEARGMRRLARPIIDVHTHISGPRASRLYARVAELYGVGLTWSMTPWQEVEAVAEALGDRVRFIAVPNYRAEDKRHHLGEGFLKDIERFHALGARVVKFWAAPRSVDYGVEMGDPQFMRLDAPHRVRSMELAAGLGMLFMTHVADPDTWFRTRYADTSLYGTKRQQYEPLEELLERFGQPWIAAHLGGWPEDLEFLTGLLERHDNLHLDTSATKWMVRELSRHSRSDLERFLRRFRGRILFGSDIVTLDEHLESEACDTPMAAGAGSPEEAFDLYASRYWALRTLFESRYVGESPIADPDLMMVDPERYGPGDAPPLLGKDLPDDILEDLYWGAASRLLGEAPG